MNKRLPVFIWLPILLVAFSGGLLAVFKKEAIKDWLFFRSYQPSTAIAAISDAASFNDVGERLFFRADPELIDADEAGQLCLDDHNLGCLVTGPKIYIVDTGDSGKEIDLQIVTATHEMLHMAYFRLSGDEKSQVNMLLKQELAKPANRAINNQVSQYDDDTKLDEAHSRFGSEVGSLSDDLVEHFDQYFSDRSKVVDAHNRSKSLLNSSF